MDLACPCAEHGVVMARTQAGRLPFGEHTFVPFSFVVVDAQPVLFVVEELAHVAIAVGACHHALPTFLAAEPLAHVGVLAYLLAAHAVDVAIDEVACVAPPVPTQGALAVVAPAPRAPLAVVIVPGLRRIWRQESLDEAVAGRFVCALLVALALSRVLTR